MPNQFESSSLKSTSLFPFLSLIVFALTSPPFGQFVVTEAGPISSNAALGSPQNESFSATYIGSSLIFSTLDFEGSLTEVFDGTFASEADFDITVNGNSNNLDFDSTSQTDFDGTIDVARSASGFFWVNDGDQFNFESFESFDDNEADEADSMWTDLSFTYSGTASTNALNNFLPGSFVMNTNGSSYDTELALFTSTGELLANDDDGGNDTQSQISADLAEGDYIVLIGGFNSIFGNQHAIAGADDGDYVLSFNGIQVATGTANANQFAGFSFSVTAIPEPSSSIVVVGLLIGAIWQRKRHGVSFA